MLFNKKHIVSFNLVLVVSVLSISVLTAQNTTLKLDASSCNKSLTKYSQICADYYDYSGSLNLFQFLFEKEDSAILYTSTSPCIYLDEVAGLSEDSAYNVKVRGVDYLGDTIVYGASCSLNIIPTVIKFTEYLAIKDDTLTITSFYGLFHSGVGSGTYDYRDSITYHVLARNLFSDQTYYIDTIPYTGFRSWDIMDTVQGLFSFKIRAEVFGDTLDYGDSIIVNIDGLPEPRLSQAICDRDSFALNEVIYADYVGLLEYEFLFVDVETNDTILQTLWNGNPSFVEGVINIFPLLDTFGFAVNHEYEVRVRNILPTGTPLQFGDACNIKIVNSKFVCDAVEMDLYIDTSRILGNEDAGLTFSFFQGYNNQVALSDSSGWDGNMSLSEKLQLLISQLQGDNLFSASGIFDELQHIIGIKLSINNTTGNSLFSSLYSSIPFYFYDSFKKHRFSSSLTGYKNPNELYFKPVVCYTVIPQDTTWFNVFNTDIYVEESTPINIYGNTHNKGIIYNKGRFLNSGVVVNIDTIYLVDSLSVLLTYVLELDSGVVYMRNNAIQLFKKDSTSLTHNQGRIIFSDSLHSGKIIFNSPETGSYVIPCLTQALEDIFISFQITDKGQGNGQFSVGTYQTKSDTVPNNQPYPAAISGLNSLTDGTDNSLYVVDRYWNINIYGYNQKPTYNLSLKYTDDNLQGDNTIVEDSLIAQMYDGDRWRILQPSYFNSAENKIQVDSVNSSGIFVLVDKNYLLDTIPKIIVLAEINHEGGNGRFLGSIYLNISGGIPPYQIEWSDIEYPENYTEWREEFDSLLLIENNISEADIERWYENTFKESLRTGLEKGIYSVIVRDTQFRQKTLDIRVGEQMNWIYTTDVLFNADSTITKVDSINQGGLIAGNLLLDSLSSGHIEFSVNNYYSDQIIGYRSQGSINEDNFYTQMPIESGTENFYFFRLKNNLYSIWEFENTGSPLGFYNSDDVFKIEKDNNYIKYYRNNVLLRSTEIVPDNNALITISKLINNASVKNIKGVKYGN